MNSTRRPSRLCHCLVWLLAPTLLLGCATEKLIDTIPISSRSAFQKGPITLDITNASGSVSVLVRKDVEPQIRVRPVNGPAGHRTQPVAHGNARWVRNDSGASLVINAGSVAEPVAVSVLLPACDSLRIRSANGPVDVSGVNGPIDIRNDSGGGGTPVTVYTTADLTGPINIRAGHGDITLTMGDGSAGTLLANTPAGQTRSAPGKATCSAVKVDRTTFTGVFNKGTNPWTIEAQQGNLLLTLQADAPPPPSVMDLWPW